MNLQHRLASACTGQGKCDLQELALDDKEQVYKAGDQHTMSSRSEASWTSDQLIWGILAADKEHSPAHRFDNEAESLLVVLEKPQKITQRTRAPKNINGFGIEMLILCEDRFDRRFHGMLWVPRGILVPEIPSRVLRKLRRCGRRVPQCRHTFFDDQIVTWEVILNDIYQET